MTLRQTVAFAQISAYDSSPMGLGPQQTSQEEMFGLQPIPSSHPPSLKNPMKVKLPTPQDGWGKHDSKAARKQAYADMAEIHKRSLTQMGKPNIAHVAQYPMFPRIDERL